MSSATLDGELRLNMWRTGERNAREQERHRGVLAADLQESLAREKILLREKSDLSQRQVMLTQEFEHRLINSLQLIVSLLSLQSRAATTLCLSVDLPLWPPFGARHERRRPIVLGLNPRVYHRQADR